MSYKVSKLLNIHEIKLGMNSKIIRVERKEKKSRQNCPCAAIVRGIMLMGVHYLLLVKIIG